MPRPQVRAIATYILRLGDGNAILVRYSAPRDVPRCLRCRTCVAASPVAPDGTPGEAWVCALGVEAADLVDLCFR